MKVLADVLAGISEDCPISDIRSCIFWTAVTSRHCGLASTVREDAHHGRFPVPEAGSLFQKSALELSQSVFSESPSEASIGLAAINSLIDIDTGKCAEQNAFEILRTKGAGRKVAIVGHFPFVQKLKETAACLWVLERNPQEGDLPESAAEEVLPQADVVGLTATSLINHTFEYLVSLCRDCYLVMLGPSTPMTPVLFDHGVHVLSGVMVTDPDAVLRTISQGATFKQVQGVRLLTMIAQ